MLKFFSLLVFLLKFYCACVCAKSYVTLCDPYGLQPVRLLYPGYLHRGFFRQECWSGLSCPSPGDLPHPGTEPTYPAPPALQGRFFTAEPPGKPKLDYRHSYTFSH